MDAFSAAADLSCATRCCPTPKRCLLPHKRSLRRFHPIIHTTARVNTHQLSEQRDLRQSRCYCPYCCHEPAGTGHGGCQIVILRHNREQRSLSAHNEYTLLLTRCASCPCDLPCFFYLLPEICTQKRTVISHGAFLIRRYQNLVVFRRMEGPMVVLM